MITQDLSTPARRAKTLLRALLLLSLVSCTSGCYWIKAVSVDSSGDTVGVSAGASSISADGRYVAYSSVSDSLVLGDSNGEQDVFISDIRTGVVTRVSIASSGSEGNSSSVAPGLSADGRYVAFESFASNLVLGDTNGDMDVFVHDTSTGVTTRVSVDSAGNEGGSDSNRARLSSDGRYVVFDSQAQNLVPGDGNAQRDVFVHDTQTGSTTRVSVGTSGNEGNGRSQVPSISGDGRYVAFQSSATNLVTGDTNGVWDIFVHDTQTGATERVSTDSAGSEGDLNSFEPKLSADGRFVAFRSLATNMVVGDTNNVQDIFIHDRQTDTTTRVSVDGVGNEGNGFSTSPSISADGRYVAFQSSATNLVVGDTNAQADIFVHDTQIGSTTRISTDSEGNESDGSSFQPSLAAEARYLAFVSNATNLVSNDTNAAQDVFIRAVPQTTVTSVTPEHLPIGATTSVTVSGTYFLPGANIGISGPGKSVTNKVVVDENTITMDVTIQPSAATGARSVTVSLPGTGPGTIRGVAGTCENCVTFQ